MRVAKTSDFMVSLLDGDIHPVPLPRSIVLAPSQSNRAAAQTFPGWASVRSTVGPWSGRKIQWSYLRSCPEQPLFAAVVRCTLGRKLMDKSVGQARWLLALVFAVAITFMAIAISHG